MRGLNKVLIIGHLGRDPDLRYTASGTAVTNFTVAVKRTRRDPGGDRVEDTEWFRVVAWQQLAETCDRYLRKGSKVFVDGRLQSRKYVDKDGVERTAVELVAGELIMLDGRPEGGEGAATPPHRAAPAVGNLAERAAPASGQRGDPTRLAPRAAPAPPPASKEEDDSRFTDLDDIPFD